MVTTLDNLLDQALDIAGSLFHTDSLDVTEESSMLGTPLSGQTGAAASITGTAPDMTITGLTGMTAESINNFLTISGAATGANNGTFLISEYISATSVVIQNASGVGGDANNGAISWTERTPYSLENDLNYSRSDRADIKGVAYDAAVPTYFRCTDQGTAVPANLSNLAGKTLDAKSLIVTRKFENVTPVDGDGYVTITDASNLKHADAVDITGVPINDGFDAGSDEKTYVEVIADGYEAGLVVLSGPNVGDRIFGRTRAGTSGTSPDSVEVEWRSVSIDAPLSSSSAYTWEVGQPDLLDLYYSYRECMDSMSETALRTTFVNGLVADAGLSNKITEILYSLGINDGDTDLGDHLTNTGMYYPFYNLPDATPSVVEALNTLNEQIGDRTWTGIIDDNDGYTITAVIQSLADYIASTAAMTRTIERIVANISAGTEHTLPGGLSYTLDPTDNGGDMWVFWRGLLRDPGTVANADDYEETSTTSITPYTKIKAGDHINYFI